MRKTLDVSRPLVVLALTELIAIVCVQAWNAFDPRAPITYLLAVYPLVCLEGLNSRRLMVAQKLQTTDVKLFRVIELLAMGFALKIVIAYSTGAFIANLPVVDARTVVSMVTSFGLWLAMLDTAYDFKELDEPLIPGIVAPNEYVSPVDRLTRRFFTGGILLFVLATISVQFGQLASLTVVFLAYFMIGLLFLPTLRFQMERHRWQAFGIRANDAMVIPWVRAGIVLVVLAGTAALLLPTHFGSGLLDTFQAIFSVIINFFEFIILLLFWLITLPMRLLLGNLGAPPVFMQPPPPPPPPLNQSAPANPLLDLLPKLFLVAVVIYIVVSYFRDHPEFWEMIRKLKIIAFVLSVWQSLWQGVGTLTRGVRVWIPATLPRRNGRRGPGPIKPTGFIRLNALSARERIIYFYLTTVRRAAEQGLQRNPVHTPHEYSEALKPKLPEHIENLDGLTEAFVEARYSVHSISPDKAKQVESHWKVLRQALRALGKVDKLR